MFVDEITKDHMLIVCDVKNHKLKLANLTKWTVETLAGTGKRGVDAEGGKDLLSQEITSPWDIVYWKEMKFLIAMAGIH